MATVGKVIHCKAAVCWAANEPLSIEEVSVEPPRGREVRVRMVSTSFCHSDLNGITGTIMPDLAGSVFPIIVGHEGAGVVESVGPDASSVQPGDPILPLFAPQCGECALCKSDNTNACLHNFKSRNRGEMADGTSRITCKGKPVKTFYGCATLSEYFVLDETMVAKINPKADLRKVGVASCCIPTGVGATRNRNLACVTPGSACAIWGLGAVGLSTALGCKMAGASSIVGIDLSPEKAALGKKFGCTEVINPSELDVPIEEYLCQKFNGGLDFTFECIGNVNVMKTVFECARPCGGVCVIQGVSTAPDKFIQVHPMKLLQGTQIRSALLGGLRFRFDVPALVDEIVEGKIDADMFITDTIRLDQINEAIDNMRAGRGIRYVILY